MKSLLAVLVCLWLIGCATSTGILPMGPDTYTITSHSELGSGSAKKKALVQANTFATSKGKYMIPVNVNTGIERDVFGDSINTYELTFRLVDQNDPEYQRTNLKKAPDVVIQRDDSLKANIDVRTKEEIEKTDLYNELTKLEDLRTRGILTDEEFQAQKKRLLENQK